MPPVSSRDANARTYPSTIHWRSLIVACSSRLSVGRATFTTVLSSITMASAKHIVSRTISFSRWFSPSNSVTVSSFPGFSSTTSSGSPTFLLGSISSRDLAIGADGDRDERDQDERDPHGRLQDQPAQALAGRGQELSAADVHRPDGERPNGVRPDRHGVV